MHVSPSTKEPARLDWPVFPVIRLIIAVLSMTAWLSIGNLHMDRHPDLSKLSMPFAGRTHFTSLRL
jgi:hypothetical protein